MRYIIGVMLVACIALAQVGGLPEFGGELIPSPPDIQLMGLDAQHLDDSEVNDLGDIRLYDINEETLIFPPGMEIGELVSNIPLGPQETPLEGMITDWDGEEPPEQESGSEDQ